MAQCLYTFRKPGMSEAGAGPGDMGAYVFLCDDNTEKECLDRSIAGTTHQNALWALEIHVGDTIFVYNFRSTVLHGPYSAASAADCYEPLAWGGKFPVQVRLEESPNFRSIEAADVASPLTLKLLRRGGPMPDRAVVEMNGAARSRGDARA